LVTDLIYNRAIATKRENGMNVRELKAALQDAPDDAEVVCSSDWMGETFKVNRAELDLNKFLTPATWILSLCGDKQ
jgi:hypothetical protein